MLKWLILPILLIVPVVSFAAISRDLLWATVQTCVVTKKVTGVSFPCLTVDGRTAALRVPGNATHVVVMPTQTIIGLESPILQTEGNTYWQAALAARHYVADAVAGRMPLEDIAIAINSSKARTQDQLHIHLECVREDVKSILVDRIQSIEQSWHLFPVQILHQTFFVRKIADNEIPDYNPFLDIKKLPIGGINLRFISFAAISLPASGSKSAMVVLATLGTHAQVEELEDRFCSTKST